MSSSSTTDAAEWRPKAVIFDLLTGLLDSWTLWDASTPSGTPKEGRLWRARYLEVTFNQRTYAPYEDFVRQAARDVGLPDSAPEALLRNWHTLKPWPEVADVLRKLKARGYKLGIVTNCSKELGHAAAERAGNPGMGMLIDTVVTGEESGFYKPTREAYQAILDAMGVEASEALFVAGSAGDVGGATRAGMKVVWHNHVGLANKGDAVPLKEAKSLDGALAGFL